MTDEELVKRLREGATWDDDVAAADRIEALTEQLEAARADAKEAEAYAEELAECNEDFSVCNQHLKTQVTELQKQLNICYMAQAVMDNTVAELEAKLSTCEEIGRAFEEDAGQLRDKLAKAMTHVMDYSNDPHLVQFARATLAEIEGSDAP
jgi:septal ring factor EnvC (AmiA/AmiB activator)